MVVLTAGGGGFLLLQRRTGALAPDAEGIGDADGGHLTGLDATAVGHGIDEPAPHVLEWDEAIDGAPEGRRATGRAMGPGRRHDEPRAHCQSVNPCAT
jgi:hypothetical protein